MEKCGDGDDCISTAEATELASALSEEELNSLPLPGQVDFINGGPPCQVLHVLLSPLSDNSVIITSPHGNVLMTRVNERFALTFPGL